MPELSVIVVNYNDRKNLGLCLSSIQEEAKGIDFEALVVDNGSTDASPEYVALNFPWVKLITNGQNTGFARANNLGLKESNGEFILFLNTDAVICPKALALLLSEIKKDASIGVVAPALLTGERSHQVSFGRRVDFFSELVKKCFWNAFQGIKLKIWSRRENVRWVSAASMLARRRALEEAGGFDENFFLYFEDIDLCYRIKELGWKVVYDPRARVYHQGGSSTSAQKARSRLEYRKSQVYFYRKHNSAVSLFLLGLYLRLDFWLLSVRGTFERDENKTLRVGYLELIKALK